jgi:hypothetical protein
MFRKRITLLAPVLSREIDMFRMLFLIPLFVGVLPAAVAQAIAVPDQSESFHLFLLVGQSNMAGRGNVSDADREVHPQVLMLNKQSKWVPAQDPMHFDKPKIVGVGLGRTFAIDYAAQHPGITVGLIPCAVGGSPISAWAPGGFHPSTNTHPFDDAVPRAILALQSGTLKGVLWHQGEGDSNATKAPAYEKKLHELIARFRKDLNAANVPFIAGQMGQFPERPWNDARKMVDSVHRQLPASVPYTAFVSSAGLNHRGDEVHFDSSSYREFGHRYFRAYQTLIKQTESKAAPAAPLPK